MSVPINVEERGTTVVPFVGWYFSSTGKLPECCESPSEPGNLRGLEKKNRGWSHDLVSKDIGHQA